MFKRITLLVSLALVVGCSRQAQNPPSAAIDPGKYYAVLMNNNTVYFGKLEGLGSEYLVLQDVFYVQSRENPETKSVNNVLVKRGKEWHAPDRMIINEKAVVFIEPVGSDSQVAQLIAEAKK